MNELAQDTLERVVHLVELLKDPRQWWQVLALVVVFGLAWLAARGLRRSLLPRLEGRSAGGAELGRVALERWILPALGALGTLIAAAVLSAAELPHALLRIATILAASLVAVRVVVYLLKHVLKPGPLLEASEHAITWAIWTLVAFALLGLSGTHSTPSPSRSAVRASRCWMPRAPSSHCWSSSLPPRTSGRCSRAG
jgi:hypothetical protein